MSRAEELVFVPLGGVGEIGMNMAAYGFGPEGARKWIVVDCGVSFGRPQHMGVELIMADPAQHAAHLKDVTDNLFDDIKNGTQDLKGQAKEAAGDATDDHKLQAEGKMDKAKGKVENAVGGVKDSLRDADED